MDRELTRLYKFEFWIVWTIVLVNDIGRCTTNNWSTGSLVSMLFTFLLAGAVVLADKLTRKSHAE
jgi:hypothetical protein